MEELVGRMDGYGCLLLGGDNICGIWVFVVYEFLGNSEVSTQVSVGTAEEAERLKIAWESS